MPLLHWFDMTLGLFEKKESGSTDVGMQKTVDLTRQCPTSVILTLYFKITLFLIGSELHNVINITF